MRSTHYYTVLYEEGYDYGVAYGEKGIFTLPDAGPVSDWRPRQMELRNGGFADFLASNYGCRLCSERLKDILACHATPDDVLQWLDVFVQAESEVRPYFILHFPDPPDVLNKDKSYLIHHPTGYVAVVKPVLNRDTAKRHEVFSYPESGELNLFVGEQTHRAIRSALCTGLQLKRARVE